MPADTLERVLQRSRPASPLPFDLREEKLVHFDFSEGNEELADIDPANTAQFQAYVFGFLKREGCRVGIGGYGENRSIYRHSALFSRGKVRSFHLGIDLWLAAGTEIRAPLEAKVHSFRENRGVGDYGPTIILEHELEGHRFYSLYGHLSRPSIEKKQAGQKIARAEAFARIGDSKVNGNWPPHLHFQLIEDLEGRSGDFPGVCAPEDAGYYLSLCPDPNLILRLDSLE